jgi:hypothetical protein
LRGDDGLSSAGTEQKDIVVLRGNESAEPGFMGVGLRGFQDRE